MHGERQQQIARRRAMPQNFPRAQPWRRRLVHGFGARPVFHTAKQHAVGGDKNARDGADCGVIPRQRQGVEDGRKQRREDRHAKTQHRPPRRDKRRQAIPGGKPGQEHREGDVAQTAKQAHRQDQDHQRLGPIRWQQQHKRNKGQLQPEDIEGNQQSLQVAQRSGAPPASERRRQRQDQRRSRRDGAKQERRCAQASREHRHITRRHDDERRGQEYLGQAGPFIADRCGEGKPGRRCHTDASGAPAGAGKRYFSKASAVHGNAGLKK